MHYCFFFDETFHDRKITVKPSGVINTFTEDKNDNYLGVFWGFENTRRSGVMKKVCALEKKAATIFGMSKEFKSTNIARKNFHYGIRSFNPDVMVYYHDFFMILKEISPIIHVNAVSKIEYLVRRIFDMSKISKMPMVQPNAFYYSLSKFILYYHSPQLTQKLYEASMTGDGKLFIDELINHLEIAIIATKGIIRKEAEYNALHELLLIVSSYDCSDAIETQYDFVYSQNFEGLCRLLDEKKIPVNKVNLTIDKEEKTFLTATSYPFGSVKQTDSNNSALIRVADHLCGFIGRMMYALMNDELVKEDAVTNIEKLSENDLERKRLQSPRWFDLQKKHFDLYKLVYHVLIIQQEAYWATMTMSLCDQVSVFYTLLRYISSYKTYEEFMKHTPEEHTEFFNGACCQELADFYRTL